MAPNSLLRLLSQPETPADDARQGDLSDEVLVRRARGGERPAFDLLCRRHARRIYALLFRLVGNHEDAEDLAQECLVRAWSGLGLFRAGDFPAWLARIGIHLARDHHRHRGRRPRTSPFEDPAARGEHPSPPLSVKRSGPAEATTQRELAGHLRRAIDELPFALKGAFCLRVFEEKTYEEIAELLGVTPATARTQVMKARRRLAQRLDPWLGSPSEGGAS